LAAEERDVSGVALVTGGARGTWRICQAFLPLIRQSNHGRIVNVASGGCSHGDPQFGLATPGGTAPGMEEMGARPIPDDGPSGGFFRDGEPLPW